MGKAELFRQTEDHVPDRVFYRNRLFNPRFWGREENDAWCKPLPDISQSFENLWEIDDKRRATIKNTMGVW